MKKKKMLRKEETKKDFLFLFYFISMRRRLRPTVASIYPTGTKDRENTEDVNMSVNLERRERGAGKEKPGAPKSTVIAFLFKSTQKLSRNYYFHG